MKLLAALLLCTIASAAEKPPSVFVRAERLTEQPVLGPRPGWAELALFNPTAIQFGGKTVLLFRAQDVHRTSRIGYAESIDGLHFTVRPEPVLSPEAPYERNGGVEDPRVVQINGLFYLTYTAFDTHSAQLCLATSSDLIHWDRKGVIMPAYRGTWNTQWTKSGAIVPQQIGGKWWMYYLGTRTDKDGKARDYMGIASSSDLLHWVDASQEPVLPRRENAFDSRVMEPGPTPIVTDAGILLLYNGADERLVYGPGWALFDRQNPARLLARSTTSFLAPEFEWEKSGTVPNVIFLEGAIQKKVTGDSVELTGYYGAADKYIGVARINASFKAAP